MDTLKRQMHITIDKWMDMVNTYSLNTLLQKPGDESWSLGQVAMHIEAETNFYILQMEKCLNSNENSNGSMTDGARVMFESNSFPPVKIKRDDSLSQHYGQPESKDDLYNRMKTLKNRLDSLAEKMERSNSEGKTRHPGLGFFNAKQWFQFAEMHMRHHLRQKERIEKELKIG